MHFYGLRGRKIELVDAEDEPLGVLGAAVQPGEVTRSAHDAERLTRATRTFFGSPVGEGSLRKAAPGRPPSVYRDARTNFLRCLYREVVVRFRPAVSAERRLAHLADFGLATVRTSSFVPDQIVVRDPSDAKRGADLIDVANALAERDGDIVLAAPNFVSEFKRTAPPAIPASQWHLDNSGQFPGQVAGEDVRAKQAWAKAMATRTIIVAVLDDGVDLDHPALKDAMWRNPDATSPDQFGRDFFLDPSDPGHFDPRPKIFSAPFNDPTGNDIHGTPCAGLVGAAAPDGRAFGVATGCILLPVKIFHADALASDERVGNAIQYAAGIADILSCSWEGPDTPLIESAIEDAASKGRKGNGCAVFCSTGNESQPSVGFPASSGSAIAVGASTDEGLHPSYSNFGPEVALVAPSNGGSQSIFTCDVSMANRGFNLGADADGGADGLYTNGFGGTSASAAIAAGAAGVILSQQPALAVAQLKQILEQTADKADGVFDDAGHSNIFGFGRVNLFAALGGGE
jgi:subtilisin family serine protease